MGTEQEGDAGELRTLNQLGIASINLNSTAANYDINGNHISATGAFTRTNGMTGQMVDAWFAMAS